MINPKREDKDLNKDPGIKIKRNIEVSEMTEIEIDKEDKDIKTTDIGIVAEMIPEKEEGIVVIKEKTVIEIENMKNPKKILTLMKGNKFKE